LVTGTREGKLPEDLKIKELGSTKGSVIVPKGEVVGSTKGSSIVPNEVAFNKGSGVVPSKGAEASVGVKLAALLNT
jgi:hypothetical protein